MCQICQMNYPKSSLLEFKSQDIISISDIHDNSFREKIKTMKSNYFGVNSNGIVVFSTQSQSNLNRFYFQYIKFKDIHILKERPSASLSELNIEVYCTDPSFLYKGYQYISYSYQYGIFSASHLFKSNPSLSGSVCKHLYHVLLLLPYYELQIKKDLKKRKFI